MVQLTPDQYPGIYGLQLIIHENNAVFVMITWSCRYMGSMTARKCYKHRGNTQEKYVHHTDTVYRLYENSLHAKLLILLEHGITIIL